MKRLLLILLLITCSVNAQTISGNVTISGHVTIKYVPTIYYLGNTATVTTTSQTIGNITVGTNKYGNTYTTTAGGSMDSVFVYVSTNYNGTDTISILIYDDNAGAPNNLVAESGDIIVSNDVNAWLSAGISGALSASTAYWIFVYNKSVTDPGNVKVPYDVNTITGARQTDPLPVNDPFGTPITTNNQEYSLYVRYQ